MNKDTAILDWQASARALETAKADEAKKRQLAIQMNFQKLEAGTNTIELGGGYKLRAKLPQNTTIKKNAAKDYSHIPAILKQLPLDAQTHLIKWEAKLNVPFYETMTAEEQFIASKFITLSDGTPTLELVEPKDETV